MIEHEKDNHITYIRRAGTLPADSLLNRHGQNAGRKQRPQGSTNHRINGRFHLHVTYNPTGSGSGIQAVSEGRCDIGLSSRDLKDEEAKTLNQTVVAIDGIAIIVNPQNTVTDLTVAQIKSIYTGEVTNWKEIGGSDMPIVLIGREAASGTRDGVASITGTKEACN